MLRGVLVGRGGGEAPGPLSEVPEIKALFAVLRYAPTDAQRTILDSRRRFLLVAGGEQAGKSLTAAKIMVCRLLLDSPGGLYWLVAADYDRTRAEFDYLTADFGALGQLREVSKRVDPGKMVLADGTVIETKSARDPRTLAMRAPNGILVCEASQIDLETYLRLRARLAPKRGWMVMTGTFETSLGWYPQLHAAWQVATAEEASFSLPSYTNTHLYPGGRDDPEIRRLEEISSDSFFMERIEGRPVPPRGLVLPEFRADLHIRPALAWIPGRPVRLWIDPGYAGAYAVLAKQDHDAAVALVDEVYERGLTTEEIVHVCQMRPWWKDVEGGAIDVAGYQHQAMAAPAEVWLRLAGVRLRAEKVRVADGTERLRGFLRPDAITGQAKLAVSPVCRGLLSEFGAMPSPFDGQTRAYRWQTDRDGNIVGNTPRDENNHAIKALIYGLVAEFGYGYVGSGKEIPVRHRYQER